MQLALVVAGGQHLRPLGLELGHRRAVGLGEERVDVDTDDVAGRGQRGRAVGVQPLVDAPTDTALPVHSLICEM
ncbi:hypothetical protein PF003_g39015 [Phytophthora fragariae]|nr:hypothetical protein PF003_g39015 [Phytophthora fragariae]